MATTHRSIRKKLNRIIEIKKMIFPRLAEEIVDLASRLPYDLCNTFRSKDFPGLKITISKPGPAGTKTDWKSVAHELQVRYQIPGAGFDRIVSYHTDRVAQSQALSIKVQKDKLVDLDKAQGYVV